MIAWILMDFTAFMGRFHPLLVHLPIGFLLMAILVEWRGGREKYQSAVSYMWLLSAASAGAAAMCGWFLANEGSYGNWTLFFHRWCGIGIVALSLAGWYYRKDNEVSAGTAKLTNWGAVLLLTITGHLGGNLTHGPEYLVQHAPAPIKKILGSHSAPDKYPQYEDADSVVVYRDIVHASLERKCMPCHNDKTQLGGLNMAHVETISEGGQGGKIIASGDLSSELLRRVTLPVTSKKFMPTSGEHMTYDEVKILEWWIMEGASYDGYITDMTVTPSVQTSLKRLFGLDMTPRPWLEKMKVPVMADEILAEISGQGWKVQQLAANQGWVEVSIETDKVSDAQLQSLLKARDQITWLELKGVGLEDEQLAIISDLHHLTRLRLQHNDITDQGVQQLQGLNRLESLNLVNTSVTEKSIEQVESFPSLRSLYLWQSKADIAKAKDLRASYPSVDIDLGAEI